MARPWLMLIVMVLVVLVAGCIAVSAAQAGGVNALIDDASDGVVNGTYGAPVVRSALAVVRGDPAYTMYSDIEGVLVDYLASITRTSTARPTPTASPHTSETTTPAATPKATPTGKKTPGAEKTESPWPIPSPTSATAAPWPPSPEPGATAWDRAMSRLAAVPWLFALPVAGVVVGIVLLRRRSK